MSQPNAPLPGTPPTDPSWWAKLSGKGKAGVITGAIVGLMILAGITSPDTDTSTSDDEPDPKPAAERTIERDEEPTPEKAAASAKPKPAASPLAKLTKDVKKNARDEVGKKRVKSVTCAPGTPPECTVEYRLGAMWDADDNEVARDVGGMLHELFRDTDVQALHVRALTDTVDNLGNETKDADAAWVIIKRSQWEQVDWDNLQYQEPRAGLTQVADAYADVLSN